MMNHNKKIIRLQDKKRNGKKRNWRGYKVGAHRLYHSFFRLDMKRKGYRVYECGVRLEMQPTYEEGFMLEKARFCGDKLCPMCAWRRAKKLSTQLKKIIDHMEEEEENYRYIFITLTQRNVKGEDLAKEYEKIRYAFNRLTKKKEFKEPVEGWMRATEVTKNWENDTYHTHIHILAAVKEEYFTDWENYLTHERLKIIWTELIGQDEDDQAWVHIQKVKTDRQRNKDGKKTYRKTIAEMTKYTAKSNDYLVSMRDKEYFMEKHEVLLESKEQCDKMTDDTVYLLSTVLHGKRMIGYGGKFLELHKKLNLSDPNEVNEDDPVENEKEEENETKKVAIFNFDYKLMDYILDTELTDPEVVEMLLRRQEMQAVKDALSKKQRDYG